MLGTIRSFDVREGMVFRWPVKSAAMFSPECGGVLADIGTHVLDLLLWWFGDVAGFEYWDDAAGGVEADAVMHLEMASGVTGRVELSRTRDLRNSCVIRGERGTLEVGTKTDSTVTLTPAHGQAIAVGPRDVRRTSSRRAISAISSPGRWPTSSAPSRPAPSPAVPGIGGAPQRRRPRGVLPPPAAARVPVRIAARRRRAATAKAS